MTDGAPVRTGGSAERTLVPIPEPVVVEVDLGLRIILALASIGAIAMVVYGGFHRASIGLPLDRGAVLVAVGFLAFVLLFASWLGWTRVVITNDRVRIVTLFGTHETDRTAIIGIESGDRAPPFLRLADDAQVVRISRRHPEGRPIRDVPGLSLPGMSRPRLETVLAGKPDPDDLDLAESVQLVKDSFVNDAGEPKWTIWAIFIAGGCVVVILIAAGLGSSG